MLMVYLIGLGTCVSFYFMYRNKKKISFQLLKYYTYLDEFFTKFSKSEDTKFLYPYNDSFVESSSLKPTLINIKEYNFPYIITRDFIVKEEDKDSSRKSKEYYQIYKLLPNDDNDNDNIIGETINVIESVNPIQLGIQSIEYENNFIEKCFTNHMRLFENIEWDPKIIAASISIIDKNNVYTFREFDMTQLIYSILRDEKMLKLNNDIDSKILWIHFFNYIFKDKNILVPCAKEDLENYELYWTIVFDDCSVKEGNDITID
jgi:hypothetical protein